MSKSHIEKLKIELKKAKWIVRTDLSTNEFLNIWEIERPNGDSLLKMSFSIFGNGNYGACIGNETMDNANGCSVEGYSEIDIYFGKYTGRFQKDLTEFIFKLNQVK